MIEMLFTWWPILAGLGVSLAAFVGRWLHNRAVITAEQRGRVDEIERQRAATDLGVRLERAQADRLEAEGQAGAAAARASTSDRPVTAAEVDDLVAPPRGPPS